jgi:hypothetical protein
MRGVIELLELRSGRRAGACTQPGAFAGTLTALGKQPALDEALRLRNARGLRMDLPLVPEPDLGRSVGSNARHETVVPVQVAAAVCAVGPSIGIGKWHAAIVRAAIPRPETAGRVAADETAGRRMGPMPTYLTPSEANVLVDAIQASLPAMYATVEPSDRQEAFAAEANAILELVEPEHQVALFERLESIVLLTDGFERPLAAND